MSDSSNLDKEKKSPDASKNWAAITGFILSLAAYPVIFSSSIWALVFWIIAIIFGSIGFRSEYRGLALAAIIVSVIPFAVAILSPGI